MALRLVLMFRFMAQPGGVMEFHLPQFIDAWQLLPYNMYMTLAVILGTIGLLAWRWPAKPLELRRAMLLIGLPIMALYLLFGMPGELRVFMELSPIIIPLTIGGFSR